MSINGIISTAFTGLTASQAALRTTSNNVANVNSPGYARQVVSLEAIIAGSQGAGVRVAEIERVADRFLELSVYESQGDASRFSAINDFHARLQGLLGRPDSQGTLSAQLERAFSALSEVTLDPADPVRRQGVLADLARFADEVSRTAVGIQDLRADASNQISETVNTINALLRRINELNPQIVRAKVTTGELGPLQEQRAQALSELSRLIDINPIELPDGSMTVTTSTGLTLLDTTVRELAFTSPGTAAASTNFPPITITTIDPRTGAALGDTQAIEASVRSGRLRGLLELRDQELPALAENLGELARMFTDMANAVHNANVAVPPPNSLEGRNTGFLGSDRLGFTGASDFAVVNAQGQVVAKTSIDFSALGAGATVNDLITAVNSGLGANGSLSLTNGVLRFTGAPGTGVVIADDPANPSDRAGRGFSHFFGMNDLMESQVPSHFQTGLAGTDAHGFGAGETVNIELRDSSNRIFASYSLTIAGTSFNDLIADLNAPGALGNFGSFALDGDGQLSFTPAPGLSSLSPRILSDSTNRGATGVTFSDLFGLKHGSLANAARDLRIKPAVEDNPQRLALAKFDTTAAVGTVALGAGDNRGAMALADLQLTNTEFQRAGSLTAVNTSLAQYTAFVLGEAALRADSASRSFEDAEALRQDVTQRRDDFSGVNLDEEMANMVVFQNAYAAAARMLNAARELYDELLQLV
ncbi:MAG: flagellar hook-associated protein FlgK [Sphingomonadales bacterium]